MGLQFEQEVIPQLVTGAIAALDQTPNPQAEMKHWYTLVRLMFLIAQ